MRKALLLAAILVLCACGIESGRVTDKRFVAAHSETTYNQQCIMYGKYGCTAYMSVPQTTDYPDEWDLGISDGKHAEWKEVSHDLYDRAKVGDEYNAKTHELTPQ